MTNKKIKLFYRGDEIHNIKLMKKLKNPIINLFLNTYPLFYSHGIIEHYFEDDFKEEVVTQLGLDGFIKIKGSKPRRYRLTPKGMDLAISLINLEHNKNISENNRIMKKLTSKIFLLTFFLAIIGITSLIVTLIIQAMG